MAQMIKFFKFENYQEITRLQMKNIILTGVECKFIMHIKRPSGVTSRTTRIYKDNEQIGHIMMSDIYVIED